MLKTESTRKTEEIAQLQTALAQAKERVLLAQPGRERFCWLAIQAIIEGKIAQLRIKENG